MRRDPTEFRKRFAAYKNGKPIKEIYDGGYIKEPVITPDSQYNEYLNSLPDNQRLTPESSYRSRRYWELNGKPKNFSEAIGKGMFNFDFSDMGWHANSVALDEKTGEYEFMKPNWHNTKMYEDAWYYSKDGEDFRNKYTKKAGQAYDKYIPKFRIGGTIGMPAMPAIAEQNSESVHNTLSYIPFIGTGMDIRDALNGDRDAIVPAMIGVAADTFGFNSIRNAIRATNAFKSAVKNKLPSVDAYRLMKEANNKVRTALGGVATYASDIYSNTLQMFQNKKKNIQTMKSE